MSLPRFCYALLEYSIVPVLDARRARIQNSVAGNEFHALFMARSALVTAASAAKLSALLHFLVRRTHM